MSGRDRRRGAQSHFVDHAGRCGGQGREIDRIQGPEEVLGAPGVCVIRAGIVQRAPTAPQQQREVGRAHAGLVRLGRVFGRERRGRGRGRRGGRGRRNGGGCLGHGHVFTDEAPFGTARAGRLCVAAFGLGLHACITRLAAHCGFVRSQTPSSMAQEEVTWKPSA